MKYSHERPMDFACRFHGIDFQNDRPQTSGYFLDENALVGWDASAPQLRQRVQRVGGGEFFLPGKLGAKTITISGGFLAPSKLEAHLMRDKLNAMPLTYSRLMVEEPGTDERTNKWAWAALASDTPTISRIRGGCNAAWATFSFQLHLPEPYKYGRLHSKEMRVGDAGWRPFNAGTVHALPTFRIIGPSSPITIRIGGLTLHVDESINAGQELVYDAQTETLVHSEYGLVLGSLRGDRISYPTGDNQTLKITSRGGKYKTAKVQVEFWETFI